LHSPFIGRVAETVQGYGNPQKEGKDGAARHVRAADSLIAFGPSLGRRTMKILSSDAFLGMGRRMHQSRSSLSARRGFVMSHVHGW
jgi:hypothetical protein